MGPILASLLLTAAVDGPAPDRPASPPDRDPPATTRVLVPSARAGLADLFLVDPATGDSRNLTRTERAEEVYPAWCPDGKRVAFACKTPEHNFEVYVCDADGSNRRRVSTPPDGPSMCFAPSWSPDGTRLVYGRSTPPARFEVRVAAADGSSDDLLQEGAFAPAWSPDGKQIAFVRVGPDKRLKLAVMNPDGTGVRVLVEDFRADLCFPAWSPDGRLIAYSADTGYGWQLFLVPAAGGPPRQLTHLPGFNVNPVWLSADRLLFGNFPQLGPPGGGYATVRVDGSRLEVHPLTKAEPAHPLSRPAVLVPRVEAVARPAPEPGPVVRPVGFVEPAAKPAFSVAPVAVVPPAMPGAAGAVAWSADGKRLAVGLEAGPVLVGEFEGNTVRPVEVFRGHEGPADAVGFSPDGKLVHSAGADRTVRTWDLGLKGPRAIEKDHADWVGALAVSSDGKRVATAGRDGTLKVRAADTGKPTAEVAACDPKKAGVQSVAFGKDDAVVFAGCGRWEVPVLHGSVAAFDPSTGAELWRTDGALGGVWGLAVSPDGAKLAGACLDCCVRVWDAKTGRELACWKGHSDRVTGVAWGLGGRVVVSCGFDHTVRVWDAATGTAVHTLAAHASPAMRVAFAPDGKHFATTGTAGAVFVWKVE